LIAGLIAVAIATSVSGVTTQLNSVFNSIASTLKPS
jgi:Flp pilus assembly pilin Flp